MRVSAQTSLIAVDAMTWPRSLLKIRPSVPMPKLPHVAAEDGYELGWDRHAASGLGGPVLEPAFLMRGR